MSSGFEIAPINLNPGVSSQNTMTSVVSPAMDNEAKGVPATDFATALEQAGKGFVDSLEKAEATAIAGINGKATTYEVATSMMEAEQAMQMAVAVRERITNAYLEISRMQI